LIAEADHEQQMINDVIAPNQHYRNKPRRPKTLFCHHEALHCILRDYLGIPGDLTTPVFKDSNLEMMFRLSRTRVQKIFEDVMHSDTMKFKEMLRVYEEEFQFRKSFTEAAEGFPVQMACCGLIQNDEKTIRKMVPYLNETWVHAANDKLKSKGFKVDCYVWNGAISPDRASLMIY
jgi:hypothetical protein